MSDFDDLKSDIHLNAGLSTQEATGFYMIHCPICQKNDRKTGGFMFEHDSVVYNCFRGKCDATTVFKVGEPVNRKFKDLMAAIDVKIPASLLVKRQSLADKIESLDHDLYRENHYKPVVFKDGDLTNELTDYWVTYLENRCVDVDAVDLKYITSGKYRGNLAVPFKFGKQTIGYQVITRHGTYIKLFGGQKHPIYIPEGNLSREVVLVVEGTIDAMCFPNTVAVMGDHISPEQAYHLRNSNVIMIPDRTGGNKFAEQFHEYGWGLCVPPWDVKDLNAAVCKFGHMVVARMIMDNLYWKRVHGQTAFNIWKR